MRGIRGVLVLCSRWLGHQTFMRLLMDSIIRFEFLFIFKSHFGLGGSIFLLYKFEGIIGALSLEGIFFQGINKNK
jgi:hypothetical protein